MQPQCLYHCTTLVALDCPLKAMPCLDRCVITDQKHSHLSPYLGIPLRFRKVRVLHALHLMKLHEGPCPYNVFPGCLVVEETSGLICDGNGGCMGCCEGEDGCRFRFRA